MNLTKYLSLEAETNYFPKNPSGNYGETLGHFGVKMTKRFDRFGVFAKARPGSHCFRVRDDTPGMCRARTAILRVARLSGSGRPLGLPLLQ